MPKLIIGCGYLGYRVAQRWLDAGESVTALTRSVARADELRRDGITPIVGDVTRPDTLADLPQADTVLIAVGYDRRAAPSIEDVYVEGLRNLLSALSPSVERVIYISSTGVYGQNNGGWVDEQSPCEPLRAGGRACLAAETLLGSHPLGQKSVVLRLAGIYGPGRVPRQREITGGDAIDAPQEGHVNLIHVDDAARIVLLAESSATPPALYTVSDGQSVNRGDYYREVARLLDAPAPTFVTPPPDSPAALRAVSDKRISNRRLMADLSPTLQYPSYREGLAAILAAER